METFKVWDDEDSSIDNAVDIKALIASDAAEMYAADDYDGLSEGIYNGQRRIGVQDAEGKITKWEVTVEYDPTFYSVPSKDWDLTTGTP